MYYIILYFVYYFKDVNDSGALSTEMGDSGIWKLQLSYGSSKKADQKQRIKLWQSDLSKSIIFCLSNPQIYARQQSQLQLWLKMVMKISWKDDQLVQHVFYNNARMRQPWLKAIFHHSWRRASSVLLRDEIWDTFERSVVITCHFGSVQAMQMYGWFSYNYPSRWWDIFYMFNFFNTTLEGAGYPTEN